MLVKWTGQVPVIISTDKIDMKISNNKPFEVKYALGKYLLGINGFERVDYIYVETNKRKHNKKIR